VFSKAKKSTRYRREERGRKNNSREEHASYRYKSRQGDQKYGENWRSGGEKKKGGSGIGGRGWDSVRKKPSKKSEAIRSWTAGKREALLRASKHLLTCGRPSC